MNYATHNLEFAEQHLAQGEERVRRLKAILDELTLDGKPTQTARVLLAEFEHTLQDLRNERDRMRALAATDEVPDAGH